jgi:hypothetical protein
MECDMRRWKLPAVTVLALAAAACGPARVVVNVEVQTETPDGATVSQPISDIQVEILPFDRDAVFDSLEAAYSTPQPPIPEALLAKREEVAQAQKTWQQATNRWNTLRDTLQKITETMKQYSRGEARYVALFREFQDFDSQLGRVEREMNDAFQKFDTLQKETIRQSDSVRILRDNWADEAFAGVGDVFVAKERESGLKAAVDTTDANGVATAELKPGKYWVTARYELPYTELYWNVPVDVTRGDPNQVQLTRANAEERVKL